MEEYAYTSSSRSYNAYNSYSQDQDQDQGVIRKVKQTPSFLTSLHSTRKAPTKLLMKKPTAPFPPTPPRIYKVDPLHFREVVQMLTGAPPPEVAAPPLGILANRAADEPPMRSNHVVYPSVKMPSSFEQVVCDDRIGETVVEGSAGNPSDDVGGLSFSPPSHMVFVSSSESKIDVLSCPN